jgi:hypothetical protein
MVAIQGASPSGRWAVVGRETAFPLVPGRLLLPETCLDLAVLREVALVFLEPAAAAGLPVAFAFIGDFGGCFMDDALAEDELLRRWPCCFSSK